MIEIVIVGIIIVFIVLYRSSNGENVYKFLVDQTASSLFFQDDEGQG